MQMTGAAPSHRNRSLAISKNTGGRNCQDHTRLNRFTESDAPPPMITNATAPRAQALTGLRFSSFSLRDGLTGFLPARALLANCWFLWRSSNSVGCERDIEISDLCSDSCIRVKGSTDHSEWCFWELRGRMCRWWVRSELLCIV